MPKAAPTGRDERERTIQHSREGSSESNRTNYYEWEAASPENFIIGFIRVYSRNSWFKCLALAHPRRTGVARLERNEPRITQMGTDDPSKLGLAEKKRNSRKSAGRVFVFDLPDSRCECTRALDFSLWSLCPLWLNKVLVHSNIIIILNPAAGINRRFRREHRLNQSRIKYCSNTIHPQGECLELCLVLVIRAYL